MLKHRLVKPTPFFVVSILILLYLVFEWIAAKGMVEGWLYRMLHLLLPVAVAMILVDILLKYFVASFKKIWIAEVLLFIVVIYYWIIN